jgi:hypothetical protein
MARLPWGLPNSMEILKYVSRFVNIAQWSVELFLHLLTIHCDDICRHFENENINIITGFERQTVMMTFCVSLVPIVKANKGCKGHLMVLFFML